MQFAKPNLPTVRTDWTPTPGCPICHWPSKLQQELVDDLASPDMIPPFDHLCNKHRTNPVVLASHIGVCLGNYYALYTSQSLATTSVQMLYDQVVESIGHSLQKAEDSLNAAATKEETDPLKLAKGYTDLAKAKAQVATAFATERHGREAQARLSLLEHRMAHQAAQTATSASQGSPEALRHRAADLIDLIPMDDDADASDDASDD